ncbi:MAG: DUF3320 domain-containing protein [Pseudomonadota bacterium]|nr:DUF3320 domain-containing protein [Pseudomonadota bacterium]
MLFVSEKTAALNVVYRRLKQIGLGPFCLELHSNRARKAEVLQQLDQAWSERAGIDQASWEGDTQQLKDVRDRLNRLVAHLHAVHPNGWTAYRAAGEIVRYKDVPLVTLSWPTHGHHDKAACQALETIAKQLDVHLRAIEDPRNHPLAAVDHSSWSPSWQQEFVTGAGELENAAARLSDAVARYRDTLKWDMDGFNSRQLQALSGLHALLRELPDLPMGFVFQANVRDTARDLEALQAQCEAFAQAWLAIGTDYDRSVLDEDVAALRSRYREARTRWPVACWIKQRAIRKVLASHVVGRGKTDHAGEDLEGLERAASAWRKVEGDAHLRQVLGRHWRGVDSDTGLLQRMLDWRTEWQTVLGAFADDPRGVTILRDAVSRLESDAGALLSEHSPVLVAGAAYVADHEAFGEQRRRVANGAGVTDADLVDPDRADYLAALAEIMRHWRKSERKLRDWCAWRSVRREALSRGLEPLIAMFEYGDHGGHTGEVLFRVNYARWFLGKLVDADDVLREFVPVEQEQRIIDFQEIDARYMRATREYVRARLVRDIPDRTSITRDSEWATLNRELQKKTRHKPVREIMGNMPNALTTLTPCVMMSPLSIAQYMPPDSDPFDVVIFDEASQITTWDAVGAIARGRQAVIVGDPKQLPPTSFFDKRDDEEADADVDVEDMESVLDESISANLPTLNLRWHYRSHSESLITFSNHRYYRGQLVTFPSSDTDDQAVRYHHVPRGVYEKGGARVNREEAAAVVRAIVRKLRDPDFSNTVGVVTFNSEQQSLIEDLFDRAREEHPGIEPCFDEDGDEPVIVKNLESVQGDERDEIFFSVTYGPDAAGKVSMNFGPLNQAGGPRRLNVAITRARKALHVFGTLKAEHIDLTRTAAEGVRDFKHFLEYAERGFKALAEATTGSLGGHDSPFEAAVDDALKRKGWRTVAQVGVSDYRIDLGIVHPDAPGRYLAAVECDGATYHRSATARDRDLLREQVLRNLGWAVLRVWSLDWWTDAESAADRLDLRLRELLEEERAARIAGADKHPAEPGDDTAFVADDSPPDATAVHSCERPEPANTESSSDDGAPVVTRVAKYTRGTTNQRDEPPETSNRLASDLDAERFTDPDYRPILTELIARSVDTEGPLRLDVVVRTLARAHGIGRAGARIRNAVLKALPRELPTTREGTQLFLWPKGVEPDTWSHCRQLPAGETNRIEEIPLQELRVLVAELPSQGMNRSEKITHMAHRLGIRRVGKNVRERLEKSLGE